MEQAKLLVCFICGLKFPRDVFAKHLKSCQNRYMAQEERKVKQSKKPCPLPPIELQEVMRNPSITDEKIESYNQKATTKFRTESQPVCKICKKIFNSQAITTHEAECELKPKTPRSDVAGSSNGFKKANTSAYDEFRKPRVLMCAICGRQFGLTSLKIHHPQCIQKFHNEQAKKDKEVRRQLPLMPDEYLKMITQKEDWTVDEIEKFNQEANKIYRDKGLVKCTNCGRAFFVESLDKHKKNCRLINGDINKLEEPSPSKKDDPIGKPRVIMCHICGRQFGTTSLLIHQKQCIQKFLNEQRKKELKSEQRPLPTLPQDFISRFDMTNISAWKSDQLEEYNNYVSDFYNKKALVPCPNCKRTFFPTSLAKHIKGCKNKDTKSMSAPKYEEPKQTKKPRTLICYICGREFGLTSLKIHQSQCLGKYLNQQSKKDIFDRKALPEIPQNYKNMIEQENWTSERIEQFNNYMGELYKGTVLEKCYNCGRTFFHESLLKHAKTCVKKAQSASPMKNKEMSPAKLNKSTAIPSLKHIVKDVVHEEHDEEDDEPVSLRKIESKEEEVTGTTDRIKVGQKNSKALPTEESETTRKKQPRKDPLPKFPKSPTSNKLIAESFQSKGDLNQESKTKDVLKSGQTQSKNQEIKQQIKTPTAKIQDLKSPKGLKSNPSSKNITLKQPEKEVQKIQLIKCKFCQRKFEKSRLQKHQSVCPKKVQEPPKQELKRDSVLETPAQNIALEKCSKCHRNFAADRLSKHYAICKGTKQQEIMKPKVQERGKYKLENLPTLQEPHVDLSQCEKCGRKFNKDRIDKHRQICKVEPKKVAFQSKTPPIQEQRYQPKEEQAPIKVQGLDQYEEVALEECEKCHRKFQADRLSTHLSVCKGQAKKSIHQARSPKQESKQFIKLMSDLKQKKKTKDQIQKDLQKELDSLKNSKETPNAKGKKSTNKTTIDRATVSFYRGSKRQSIHLPQI